MATRIFCTLLVLLLAAGAFFSEVLMPPGPLNPFGIAFLALAGVIWFGWEMIQDAFAYNEERRRAGYVPSDPVLVRLGPIISMMLRYKRPN